MSIFGNLKDKIARYVDVHIRLFKINFIGRTAGLLGFLMFGMIALFIFFCIILFLGFASTELFILVGLTKLTSFFITIGIYFLLLVIVVACRKPITRFFTSATIRVITEEEEDNERE